MARTRGVGTIGLLRDPRARWVWAGQLTSSAGDRLFSVASTWVVAELSRSALLVALVAVATSLPYLISSLFAGAAIGTRAPLRVARSIDLLRAAVVASLPVLVALRGSTVVPLLVSAIVLSAFGGLFDPALQAGVPELVERSQAGAMVALLDSTDRIGRILGPGLVGVLSLVLPTSQLFTIDAVTFVVSAVTLTGVLRARPRASARLPVRPASWREGVRRISSHPVIGPGVGLRVACNLAWPAYTVAGPFLARQHGTGIGGYGVLIAVFGGANLLGNLLVGLLPGRPAVQYRAAWAGAGIAFLVVAVAPDLPVLLAATAFAGLCTPVANVTVDALIAAELGREGLVVVFGAQRSAVTASGLVGIPLVGTAIEAFGTGGALALGGGWILAAVVASAVLGRRVAARAVP